MMAEVEAVSDQYGALSHYCSSIYFTMEGLNLVSQTANILVQYSDKFMHTIVLYSIVLRRSQLYCIVNLLLCGYNTIQWCA